MDILPFWIRVKTLIKAHNMNHEQFAGYIDIPIGTFSGWIHFNRLPDVETACDMAAALGVTVQYLVYGDDGEKSAQRFKELNARRAAGRIDKLLLQISHETRAMRLP